VEGDELEESRKWFKERMEYMFGYPVDARIASRLHTWWLKAMFDPVTFATEPEEVQPLTVLINWDIVFPMVNRPVIFDPCAGHNSIFRALTDELPRVAQDARLSSNDINLKYNTDFHFDIIDPYQWRSGPETVDITLASVPWELADAMIPDLTLRTGLFSAFHLSSDWVANGPAWRRNWIAWLQSEGRLGEIRGLPRVKSRSTRRCTWVIIFSSADIKKALWQAEVDCFTIHD
jgi:hypothetical protein